MVHVVVPAQPLHHAERVGRALQQLRQPQVVELQPGSLRCLHAEIARLGIDRLGAPREHRRRRDLRRRGAADQRRAPGVPVRGLLVGVADTQDGRLVERPTDDLHAERQAAAPEAVGQRQHRLPSHVPRGEQAGLLPERDAAIVGQARRLAHAGGDEGVEPRVERLHLQHHPAMLARGLHVVVRGEEHGRQHARAEVGPEVLEACDQVLLVDAEDLALRDDDLDVEVLAERPQPTLFELGAQSAAARRARRSWPAGRPPTPGYLLPSGNGGHRSGDHADPDRGARGRGESAAARCLRQGRRTRPAPGGPARSLPPSGPAGRSGRTCRSW